MTGRNRLDTGKQRVWIRSPKKRQKLVQCFRINSRSHQTSCQNRFNLRGEDEMGRALHSFREMTVIERFYSDMIARERQSAFLDCPKWQTQTCH